MIRDIESGQQEVLPDDVPGELLPLTRSINELLRNEQQRQSRYRNALDDLAHSLKTPLAVTRNLAGDGHMPEALGTELQTQIDRMDDIVARQVHALAIRNRSPLTRRINLQTLIKRVVQSLGKVYADKSPDVDIAIDRDMSVRLNEGDVIEIVGDLVDNAFKYCQSSVSIQASETEHWLELSVCGNKAWSDETRRLSSSATISRLSSWMLKM